MTHRDSLSRRVVTRRRLVTDNLSAPLACLSIRKAMSAHTHASAHHPSADTFSISAVLAWYARAVSDTEDSGAAEHGLGVRADENLRTDKHAAQEDRRPSPHDDSGCNAGAQADAPMIPCRSDAIKRRIEQTFSTHTDLIDELLG
jgi:hypothetical protein